MTLGARARMRPVLYPAAILLAFVLNLLVDTGASPYAAGRPLIVALLIGLALPWLAGLVTGERQAAGLISGGLSLLLVVAQSPVVVALGLAALVLVTLEWSLARRRGAFRAAGERLWPLVTRVLTAGAVILLVAVGIKAIQMGRVETIARDLVAEFPFRPISHPADPPAARLPNMYFVLLDGYPRADKLASKLGIDVSGFVSALEDRGFFVATHSRSNHTVTRGTLTQLFNYVPGVGAIGPEGRPDVEWRHRISEGRFFDDIGSLGYGVDAVSSGFEHVALREADRFIDTGEPNEFEWAVVRATSAGALIETALPELAADLHRARVLGAFDATEHIVLEEVTAPRFVFTHVPAPHSPLVFDRDGSPWQMRGTAMRYADSVDIAQLGRAEYVRRLDGQIAFINTRTLDLADRIIARDPTAVVVVFSDHGTGLAMADADLRTANLLAVRSPGRTGIIDDRSTLANLLPRLLRAYAGTGPPDVLETIYAWADEPGRSFIFERPD
jgi:hypothetical protein